MSRCISLGSNPEVDEPNTPSGPATRLAVANNCCLSSSRSGALSWTNEAPSTASSTVVTMRSEPSAGHCTIVNLPYARRALAMPSPTLRGASGSGSNITTSWPFNKKRAAQPPPITPPPSRPMWPLVMCSPSTGNVGWRPGRRAGVDRRRPDEPARSLLLEDVGAPSSGAGAGEHRREHVCGHLGEVEDHGRPELHVGGQHAVGVAGLQFRECCLFQRLGHLDTR